MGPVDIGFWSTIHEVGRDDAGVDDFRLEVLTKTYEAFVGGVISVDVSVFEVKTYTVDVSVHPRIVF